MSKQITNNIVYDNTDEGSSSKTKI